jgi:3-hydroxy-5-phosphonooxypentane-2,4-dione thiolase
MPFSYPRSSTMDWGMQNRLSRIFAEGDSRCLMLAVDHGYFLGPTYRLEIPKETIQPLLPYTDSLMLTRGVLRTSVDPKTNVPIVLRVSGGSSILGEDLSNETITTSIEEALRINASCLAMSIFVGSKYEHQTLRNLSKLVDKGERYGIPILAVTAVGREMTRDYKYLGLACRIAAELGAHIVKTYYCDEFEKVVDGCPVPVIIAGGKKVSNEKDVLKLTYESISKGAVGVDMGRNIWQSDYPVAMIQAVRSVVHQGLDVNQAYEKFLSLKHENIEDVIPTSIKSTK